MKTFNFNGYSSDEFGIYVSGKDIHSAPARSQEFISVPGRDGAVIIDNGNYENVNVSYTCYCKDLLYSMNAVKAWLCRLAGRLQSFILSICGIFFQPQG